MHRIQVLYMSGVEVHTIFGTRCLCASDAGSLRLKLRGPRLLKVLTLTRLGLWAPEKP